MCHFMQTGLVPHCLTLQCTHGFTLCSRQATDPWVTALTRRQVGLVRLCRVRLQVLKAAGGETMRGHTTGTMAQVYTSTCTATCRRTCQERRQDRVPFKAPRLVFFVWCKM